MQTILEYIMLNYTWIIAGSIIILLAVIGYYADKTNFGQGKNNQNETLDKVDIKSLEGKRMDDLLQHNDNYSNDLSETAQNDDTSISSNISENNLDNNIESSQNAENTNVSNVNSQIDSLNQSEENFEKFDKQFNELLPKKNILDDELLDEIDNLSLDKTQKIDISEIPDVDDVDLPKIKSLPFDEEDIWKF